MGEVMKGCTFPGRMISCAGAVGAGDTTDTAVMATCDVSVGNFALALTRERIPVIKRAAVTTSAIGRASQRLYERFAPGTSFNLGNSGDCPLVCFTSSV